MNHSIIISLANELIRIVPDRIVYISSDGNYSTMILHDNAKHLFSFNLSHFQRIIEMQLKAEASMFIRLGRSIIVNREYIYKINISKQEMVLSDKNLNEAFTISASKEALKQLKSLLESEIAK